MLNIMWNELNSLQKGMYGEYYAKLLFGAYGFDVYTSEIDYHGVDFVAKNKKGDYLEVQVKTICKATYAYIRKDKIELDNKHIVALVRLEDFLEPEMFLFPAKVWNEPNEVFKVKTYEEVGINYSKKNRNILEKYMSDKILPIIFSGEIINRI